jgi:hypothetical protein
VPYPPWLREGSVLVLDSASSHPGGSTPPALPDCQRRPEIAAALVERRSAHRPIAVFGVVTALGLFGLALPACTPKPETVLLVTQLSAVNADGEPVGDLFSDVCQGSPDQCVVRPDMALVTLSVQAENPYTDLSHFGDIVVDRYRVTYVRADGRNTPGVDVPYPFDGAINFRIPADAPPTGQPFMVVRPQAKLEAPLRNLAGGGGLIVLSVIARVEVYGRQVVTDEAVSARGSLNITFADFEG